MNPISNLSLRRALSEIRSSLPKTDRQPRVAFVGVGSELRGDDAAGPVIARRLEKRFENRSGLLAYEAGSVPENTLGPLRRFSPDLVFLIDVAEMNAAPGEIQWVDRAQIDGMSASTHTFPLSFIMNYFEQELNCRVELLAIQPAQFEFDTPLSVPVRRAVQRMVRAIVDEFAGSSG